MSETVPAPPNLPEYTVGELAAALKRAVEDAFGRVRVRGEISGLKRAASGHVYLTLKDDKAVLDGVIWRGTATGLRFAPEDGLEVVAEGRLTTYPARSRYQIVIDRLEPAGVGALLALIEERRKKLAAEGLFDPARKRPPPFLPDVIGVVTSPTGAVIRDILHRLRDRFPRPVLLWPVLVQGESAAAQIAAAIEGFNRLAPGGPVPRPDVLIVARGGGSIEDLWPFNEEIVVRAAAASEIPLISAVGHETDTTLIDLAADLRAPTPTAAAEMVVPVRADLMVTVAERQRQLIAAMVRRLSDLRRATDSLARGLPRPDAVIGEAAQRLDDRVETVVRVFRAYLDRLGARLAQAGLGLGHPRQRLALAQGALAVAASELLGAGKGLLRERRHAWSRWAGDSRLEMAFARAVADQARRLATATTLLRSCSHRRVLERGYAVVRGADKRLITRAKQVGGATEAEIQFFDGARPAVIGDGDPPRKAPRKAPRKPGRDQAKQGRLL